MRPGLAAFLISLCQVALSSYFGSVWPFIFSISNPCAIEEDFSLRVIRSLTMPPMLFASPRVCGCSPFANTPPDSCNKVIRQVLRWLHRVVSKGISVPSYDVMRFSVSLHISDDSLCIMFCRIYFLSIVLV